MDSMFYTYAMLSSGKTLSPTVKSITIENLNQAQSTSVDKSDKSAVSIQPLGAIRSVTKTDETGFFFFEILPYIPVPQPKPNCPLQEPAIT